MILVAEEDKIIWDWNGTIVDDAGIALDAVNDMLREQHRPEITLEEYRNAMDTPILRFYEQFFDMKATDFNWITERFQSYYENHKDQLRLHEGVEGLLEYCRHSLKYNQYQGLETHQSREPNHRS